MGGDLESALIGQSYEMQPKVYVYETPETIVG